jgi:hypothetical protein
MNNKIAYFFMFIVLALFWGAVIFIAQTDPQREVRHLCSVAEISPDFTPEMRKQCRELLRHKL